MTPRGLSQPYLEMTETEPGNFLACKTSSLPQNHSPCLTCTTLDSSIQILTTKGMKIFFLPHRLETSVKINMYIYLRLAALFN